MLKGDIDNSISPRLLVVFEGLLGLLPKGVSPEPPEASRGRLKRFLRPTPSLFDIGRYTVNEAMAARVWDATWRRGVSVDVVTFLGPEYVELIQEWIDRYDLPVGHVTATTPHNLARSLAYMPHVAAVFDPDPSRRLTYGAKSRFTDPAAPELFGAF